MASLKTLTVYSDYKSPYAFLAKDLIYALEREGPVRLDWLPYTLDIPSYLGSARIGERGEAIESSRTPHQWRKVRYAYKDCRRQANKRGLTILGTQKIWDSSLANIGTLWAKRHGPEPFRGYHDRVFERFWRRELDIEAAAAIGGVLAEAGVPLAGWAEYAAGEGRRELQAIGAAAEALGVFGVPTFVLDGELFWGREHLPDIRALLDTVTAQRVP